MAISRPLIQQSGGGGVVGGGAGLNLPDYKQLQEDIKVASQRFKDYSLADITKGLIQSYATSKIVSTMGGGTKMQILGQYLISPQTVDQGQPKYGVIQEGGGVHLPSMPKGGSTPITPTTIEQGGPTGMTTGQKVTAGVGLATLVGAGGVSAISTQTSKKVLATGLLGGALLGGGTPTTPTASQLGAHYTQTLSSGGGGKTVEGLGKVVEGLPTGTKSVVEPVFHSTDKLIESGIQQGLETKGLQLGGQSALSKLGGVLAKYGSKVGLGTGVLTTSTTTGPQKGDLGYDIEMGLKTLPQAVQQQAKAEVQHATTKVVEHTVQTQVKDAPTYHTEDVHTPTEVKTQIKDAPTYHTEDVHTPTQVKTQVANPITYHTESKQVVDPTFKPTATLEGGRVSVSSGGHTFYQDLSGKSFMEAVGEGLANLYHATGDQGFSIDFGGHGDLPSSYYKDQEALYKRQHPNWQQELAQAQAQATNADKHAVSFEAFKKGLQAGQTFYNHGVMYFSDDGKFVTTDKGKLDAYNKEHASLVTDQQKAVDAINAELSKTTGTKTVTTKVANPTTYHTETTTKDVVTHKQVQNPDTFHTETSTKDVVTHKQVQNPDTYHTDTTTTKTNVPVPLTPEQIATNNKIFEARKTVGIQTEAGKEATFNQQIGQIQNQNIVTDTIGNTLQQQAKTASQGLWKILQDKKLGQKDSNLQEHKLDEQNKNIQNIENTNENIENTIEQGNKESSINEDKFNKENEKTKNENTENENIENQKRQDLTQESVTEKKQEQTNEKEKQGEAEGERMEKAHENAWKTAEVGTVTPIVQPGALAVVLNQKLNLGMGGGGKDTDPNVHHDRVITTGNTPVPKPDKKVLPTKAVSQDGLTDLVTNMFNNKPLKHVNPFWDRNLSGSKSMKLALNLRKGVVKSG